MRKPNFLWVTFDEGRRGERGAGVFISESVACVGAKISCRSPGFELESMRLVDQKKFVSDDVSTCNDIAKNPVEQYSRSITIPLHYSRTKQYRYY